MPSGVFSGDRARVATLPCAMKRTATVLTLLVSAYIAAQTLSDIASIRIVDVAGFSMDAGTLIYPITFTLRDLVHKVAGKHVARLLIFTAAGINLFMAAFFWLVSVLPADLQVGEQLEFGVVLAPLWRIVFASILAEVISELIDTEVYSAWVAAAWVSGMQWGRVLSSNLVAIPIDSAIFVTGRVRRRSARLVVMAVFWTNVLVKGWSPSPASPSSTCQPGSAYGTFGHRGSDHGSRRRIESIPVELKDGRKSRPHSQEANTNAFTQQDVVFRAAGGVFAGRRGVRR